MKTYVDLTNAQLRKECVKIFERVTGIKPLVKQIVLLEADADRVYFECGNITIDHRRNAVCGIPINGYLDYVEIINTKGFITKRGE